MDEKGPSKFLIYAPQSFKEIVMSFPFIGKLRSEFPESEISILMREEYRPLYLYIDQKLKTYGINEAQLKNPLELHKFAVNLTDVFNIDVYFSLNKSFAGAFLGANFRAKERVGFKGQLTDLMYTKKRELLTSGPYYKNFIDLLSEHTGREYGDEERILGPALRPFYSDDIGEPGENSKKYLVIHFQKEIWADEKKRLQLAEFLDLFEGKSFVFVGDKEDGEVFEEFIKNLHPQNEYQSLCGKTNLLELGQILAHGLGVIGPNSGPLHLASYLGTPVGIWNDSLPLDKLPYYTKAGFEIFDLSTNLDATFEKAYSHFSLT